jgi:hypothetical protein
VRFEFPKTCEHPQFGFATCFQCIEFQVGGQIVQKLQGVQLHIYGFMQNDCVCITTSTWMSIPEFQRWTILVKTAHAPISLACTAEIGEESKHDDNFEEFLKYHFCVCDWKSEIDLTARCGRIKQRNNQLYPHSTIIARKSLGKPAAKPTK